MLIFVGVGEEEVPSDLAGLPSSALQPKGSNFFSMLTGLPLYNKRAFSQILTCEIAIDMYTCIYLCVYTYVYQIY